MMDIAVADVWKIVKRRMWMIVILVALSLTVTGLLSFYFIEPTYDATAKLLVQSQNTGDHMVYSDLETNQNLMTTYSEIIKSNRITEDVIKRLDLNMTVEEILRNVKVQATENSLVTSITVRNHIPSRAVDMANGFAQSFYENLHTIMKVDNLSVLDKAELPENPTPVSPKPILNLCVAFVLALFVGICMALLLEFLDQTVKTEMQVEEWFHLPVLGVVYRYKNGEKRKGTLIAKEKKGGGIPVENESGSPVILP